MRMEYRFVPLERWPGNPTRGRRSAPFRSTFSKTCDLLERELGYLQARNVVIQADCDRSEIRLDGFLRSGAKLRGPGVILTFDSKHGPLSYPCDRYLHYEDNIRAIALSLEALRAVDRHGVTRQAEQYKGWAKLPDPNANSPFSGIEQAATFVADASGYTSEAILRDPGVFRHAYRYAAGRLHPDAAAGSDSAFTKLQAAKEMLEKHHCL